MDVREQLRADAANRPEVPGELLNKLNGAGRPRP
jgi:hypothetical protein